MKSKNTNLQQKKKKEVNEITEKWRKKFLKKYEKPKKKNTGNKK